jgi:hypothetical protein
MKTIKKDGKIKRVTDKNADTLVAKNGWSFCPKSEFKAINTKTQEVVQDVEVTSKKSKKSNKKLKVK